MNIATRTSLLHAGCGYIATFIIVFWYLAEASEQTFVGYAIAFGLLPIMVCIAGAVYGYMRGRAMMGNGRSSARQKKVTS